MVKKLLRILEPECSLPCSHQPVSGLRVSVHIFNPSFCNILLGVLAPCGNGLRRFGENAYAKKCRIFHNSLFINQRTTPPALLTLVVPAHSFRKRRQNARPNRRQHSPLPHDHHSRYKYKSPRSVVFFTLLSLPPS